MEDKKIDFVITWVDGNDKEWQEEKKKYMPDQETEGDAREVRYRDWENLKYWFRGVEKFAPWVNKIHFVTWGHVPEWLDTSNPKLNIVKHEDYIPKEYLPTFSSHPIELNLHRIEGLSEHFVYFNDDMFIIDNVKETDFFRNDLPCDSAILSPIISNNKDNFAKILQNNMNIINMNFDKNECIKKNFSKWFNLKYGTKQIRTCLLMPWKYFVGFADPHLPNSFCKETYRILWDKEEETLNNTSESKFRRNNIDVNNWLMRYYQLASGNFYPRSIKIGRYYGYTRNNEEMYKTIENRSCKLICLNDTEGDCDFEKEKARTISAFEKILPDKSSFEK